jgi:hypothetical protein
MRIQAIERGTLTVSQCSCRNNTVLSDNKSAMNAVFIPLNPLQLNEQTENDLHSAIMYRNATIITINKT